ncbi:hypothetical protein [Paraliobacillus sediminis]|uniref:hypothetical protein n=1 Tax=Paraliobacillus sediminis TaxID=1885916 RepID=UPI000E3E5E31|nr:hypothetical protein [Paraliobacillus sediminis]
MDKRIEELIDRTKTKFGLDNYYLQRHSISRDVDIFNVTNYTLCMEWFPKHITEREDDDLNPDGTAVIEIDINSHKYKRVILVMGETYANNGVSFANLDTKAIIKWIEQETGFIYGKQFQLDKEEEGKLYFKEGIDGVAVSPSGYIDLKFNQEGKLTFFAVDGQFTSKEMVKEETYTLTFEKIKHLAMEQLNLVEFPSGEQEKRIPVYAVDEIYITNDGMSTIPFEFIVDVRSYLKIDKTIIWNDPIDKPFDRKEISLNQHVSVEQAFSCEPSPASFPITKDEEEKCLMAVEKLLRQEFPDDTGKWIIKTLNRDKGYIHAVLRASHQDNPIFVFQRKLVIIIDAKSLQAVNYIDNKPLLEMYTDQFQAPDKVTISKEEAFKKMEELFELKPYYVYDFEQKHYVLCGKLDCQYGVHAGSGEVISLSDL